MKQPLRKIFFFFMMSLIIAANSQSGLAQNCTIKGKVTDQSTKKPVPFVNVGVKDKLIGTTTDINGSYQFDVPKGTYTIIFSSIEYERIIQEVILSGSTFELNISMKQASHELNMVVVSESKYATKVEESISSVEVLKPGMIEAKNVTSLDKVLDQIPGVSIVDNEPQVRGGSGFSSGLGSRVMILVDEIPMMRGDAGRPVWNFLPIEDIEQIEVIKGASSVVYGSSALNGAINIRTAYPKDKPETSVTVHGGIYNNPPRKYAKSWDGFNPVVVGASFHHARQINNVDFVAGGNVLSDPGYIGPAPDDTSNHNLNKGEYEQRIRMNFGTRVRSNRVENLTYGLNGNIMYDKNAQTYFWEDADSNIYRSYPGALTNFKEFLFYLDPYVKYFTEKGGSHALKNRYFYTNNGADNDQTTLSHLIYNEYQYSKKYKKLGNLILNAGIMNMYISSTGKVFSGVLGEVGTSTSDNLAIYAQLEKKFFKRLTVLFGGRWEYYRINSHEESKPVFRAGINARVTKVTYMRASFGQGFRFPSIGERYITTNVGNFGFYPNPDLKSETSWNAEVGIKQLFKIASFVGFLDVCGYWQEYKNYIEFNAALWGNNPDFSKNMGFKFLNTGPARVRGIDCTLTGEGKLAKNVTIGLLAGYTYSLPQSLAPHEVYYTDTLLNNTFNYSQTSSDTTNNILKYRMQHVAKLDLQISWKNFSFGVSGRYYSFMKNIDKFFINFDSPGYLSTGITDYREEYNDPNLIWDVRISYELKKHFKFAFLIDNLLNKEYSLRPITIEAPRTTVIQIVYKS
jgi:outer membrane receptor protein involved in Fe transport